MDEPGARIEAEALEADCPRHRLEPGAEPMSKLSDTPAIVLSAACQRLDGNLLPLPGALRGGAAGKLVAALPSADLPRSVSLIASRRLMLRSTGSGAISTTAAPVLLRITPAGLVALGIGPIAPHAAGRPPAAWSASAQTHEARPSPLSSGPGRSALGESLSAAAGHGAGGNRQGAPGWRCCGGPKGATIAEIVEATGWQPHAVRGAFAGALKKRFGLTVTSEKLEGRGRVYRISR